MKNYASLNLDALKSAIVEYKKSNNQASQGQPADNGVANRSSLSDDNNEILAVLKQTFLTSGSNADENNARKQGQKN
jgi:hypothetical protein